MSTLYISGYASQESNPKTMKLEAYKGGWHIYLSRDGKKLMFALEYKYILSGGRRSLGLQPLECKQMAPGKIVYKFLRNFQGLFFFLQSSFT